MTTAASAFDTGDKFPFEKGRALAERLGYPLADLDRIPAEAVGSFAGVGCHFPLADPKSGETVVDLGSGYGMDTLLAALRVGTGGRAVGIEATDGQRAKAECLRDRNGFHNVAFLQGHLDRVPLPEGFADLVIGNGAVNRTPDKAAAFREAARLMKPGGRLVVSDIVTGRRLPDAVVGNADLSAAGIGRAARRDRYCAAVEAAGLRVRTVQDNPGWPLVSPSFTAAQDEWGVRSISLLAVKP